MAMQSKLTKALSPRKKTMAERMAGKPAKGSSSLKPSAAKLSTAKTSKKVSPEPKPRSSSSTTFAPKMKKVLGKSRVSDSPIADKQTKAAYAAVRTKKRLAAELSLIPKGLRGAHEKKPLYGHQLVTLDLYRKSQRVLDFGDPGVGKTRTALQAFSERRRLGGGRLIVVAPRTLLEAAWGADIEEFCGDMRYAIAWTGKRERAFDSGADIVIINTDGVKWLEKEGAHYLTGDDPFDSIVIDELTSYKVASSDRSKSMRKLAHLFQYRAGLTGTPNSRSITDLHHQVMIIDDGVRLGDSFYRFQMATCEAIQIGPSARMVQWVDKEGIEEVVAGMLADICVRHRFEDCMDIPPNVIHSLKYHPPAKLIKHYKDMESRAVLTTKEGKVVSVNAAVLRNKLLQISSGAVYGEGDLSGKGKPVMVLDTARTELVIDLIEERPWPSVVFFSWGHQKEQLLKLAKTRGISHAVIDSTTPDRDRAQIRRDYQEGLYKAVFMHPATGAHGLTLTKGRTTIFISPTERADFLKQGIHRVYRGGQTERTETILIEAEGTVEALRYDQLQGKTMRMNNLLSLLQYADAGDVDEETC